MTSHKKQADTITVLVVCVLSLWSFVSAEATDLSQAAIGTDEPPTFVAWPEKGLGLSIDLTGFKTDIDQVKPDGRRYLTASHPKTGLNVAVTLEKVPTQVSPQGCREQLQLIRNGPLVTHAQDIALNAGGKIPTLEYTLRKFRGVRLDQKYVYACVAQDNVYADIQLSKMQYIAADAPLFQSILKSVHLQPEPTKIMQTQTQPKPQIQPKPRIPAPEPPNSRELLDMGNALYRQNKYAQAIPPYQKAFELEKAEPQLDRTLWRVLIDNLGMAYGMTGRLKEAKSTFQEGIQADPTYPMFHYNLACTFAEMNDLDHTMQSLAIAFRHRKNKNPGDKGMPDPRRNLSFQRFMKNETFRNLVNDLAAIKS
jgi:tetratricopeptide (TPR) repeat protein